MASSKLEIVNLALAYAGEQKFCGSVTEPETGSGVVAVQFWDLALDQTLAAAAWPFARTERALAVLDGDPASGWAFRYAYPADCVMAREIYPGSRNPRSDQRIPFELAADPDGQHRVILCDLTSPTLIYTRRVTAPEFWPAGFCVALAWRLAAIVLYSLGNEQRAQRADQRCQLAVQVAVAAAFAEVREDQPPRNALTMQRWQY